MDETVPATLPLPNGHDTEAAASPITVVPMTIVHLPAVRQLYQQFVAEKQPTYPTIDAEEIDVFTRCLATCLIQPDAMERTPGWVAVDGGQVVGLLFGEREVRIVGKPKDIWVAHWLIVDPAYRRNGIGRALSRAGLAWLAERNVPVVELASFAGDAQWQSLGWEPILTRYVRAVDAIAADVVARKEDR